MSEQRLILEMQLGHALAVINTEQKILGYALFERTGGIIYVTRLVSDYPRARLLLLNWFLQKQLPITVVKKHLSEDYISLLKENGFKTTDNYLLQYMIKKDES